jgi:hypothetical protein
MKLGPKALDGEWCDRWFATHFSGISHSLWSSEFGLDGAVSQLVLGRSESLRSTCPLCFQFAR